jgi:hypothetical protein
MSHSAKPNHLKRLVAAIAVIALASMSISAFSQPTANPVEDLPAGDMKAKATAACLGCHEARIILQQRLTKAAWTKEVDKMTKWGAIVDSNDHDALVDYLSTNFSPDKDPVRSATDLDRKGFPEIANSEIPPNWFFEN